MPSDRNKRQAEVRRLETNAKDRTNNRHFALKAHWNEDDDTAVDYFYRGGQLLCDESNEQAVRAAFDALGLEPPRSVERRVAGIVVFDIGDREPVDLADQIDMHVGADVVSPNHVLDSQVPYSICPASEPVPHQGPIHELAEPVGDGHARIAVVDTGYLDDAARDSRYGRLLAVEKYSEPDDEAFTAGRVIRPYGGHGTAATARLLAISGSDHVTVQVRDALVGGAVDELTIIEDLAAVIENGVDVISLQAGLYSRRGHSPLAFDAFRRRILSRYPDVVIVAAAGNNGSDQPFWPAAYEWTTAVGALTKSGDARTGWSNFGYWVDLYATGENVVVPFPNGTYEYLDETRARFTRGHALWSGTSFAAPVVAGLIARRMIERDVPAPQARDIVLDEARTAALPATGRRAVV